jgi:hypothetical protein
MLQSHTRPRWRATFKNILCLRVVPTQEEAARMPRFGTIFLVKLLKRCAHNGESSTKPNLVWFGRRGTDSSPRFVMSKPGTESLLQKPVQT